MNYKIYTGHNRLENWFTDLGRPEIYYGTIKAPSRKENTRRTRSSSSEIIEQETVAESVVSRNHARYAVGSALVRTGAIVMLVPDPLPVVDEVIAIGMIYLGAYLVSTS